MGLECDVKKQGLGPSSCNQLPNLLASLVTTPNGFSLTEAEAILSTNWQNALVAASGSRIHKWPRFVGTPENSSEEAVYEDGPLGILPVRDGNYRFKFFFKESLCFHKKMYTHKALTGRAFFVDVDGQMIGTLGADGKVRGLSIQVLNPEKLIISDGAVSTKSPLFIALADNKELDKNGVIFDVSSFYNTLLGIVDVKLEIVGTPATDSIVVSVKVACDGTPLNGLEPEDFVLLDDNGNAQNIASIEEEDGVYTLTPTTVFANGSLNLVAPSVLSVKAYEPESAVTVTIPS